MRIGNTAPLTESLEGKAYIGGHIAIHSEQLAHTKDYPLAAGRGAILERLELKHLAFLRSEAAQRRSARVDQLISGLGHGRDRRIVVEGVMMKKSQ